METETIDLTDPLEDLLRQTGLSPEYLQERIVRLSEENAKKANTNQKNLRDMTLNDLLDGFKCSNSKNNQEVEDAETIVLSDDEEVTENVTNKEDCEIQEVTEVRVIEIDDEEYNSECNDDDDDEFLEGSTTDILQSNNKDVYESSSVLEEDIDNNLIVNESTNNSLHFLDPTESRESFAPLTNNSIFKNYDTIYDLPRKNTNILIEENDKETRSSNDINSKTLTNNIDNKIVPTAVKDTSINSEMLGEKNKLSTNVDEQEKQDPSDKIQDSTHNVKKISTDSSNQILAKKISKSPSLESSYTGAFCKLDQSICNNSSEKNENINNDLGFIVSEDKGRVDLIDSTVTLSNIPTEENITNYKYKTMDNLTIHITKTSDNLPVNNKDVIFNKGLVLTTEKENMENISKLNFDQDSDTATLENLVNKKGPTAVKDASINTEMLGKKNKLSTNGEGQEKQDDPSDQIQDGTLIKKMNKTSSNPKLIKKISKSPSLGSSYMGALSKLNESICNSSSEKNENVSNDLGFIVSEDNGRVDLIDSTMTISNIATEENNTDYKYKTIDNLTIHKNDVIFNERLILTNEKKMEDISELNFDQDSDTATSENLVNKKKLADTMVTSTMDKSSSVVGCDIWNKSSSDLQGIKSIDDTKDVRKSIDEIIEQFDIACRNDTNIKSNFKEVEINNIADDRLETNNVPRSEESRTTPVISYVLEIDSSSSLLLRNQDEAIKTYDKNIEHREDFAHNSTECSTKLSKTLKMLHNVEDTSCEDKTELNKIQNKETPSTTPVAEVSENSETLIINYDSPITKSCNGEVNKELSAQLDNYTNSDNTSGYLFKISKAKLFQIAKAKVGKNGKPTDTLCSVVSNNCDENSKHPLNLGNFGSLSKTNSTTIASLDISTYNKNDTISEAHINMDKTPIFDSFSLSTNAIINKPIANEYSKNNTNGNNKEAKMENKKPNIMPECITNLSPIQIGSNDFTNSKVQESLDNKNIQSINNPVQRKIQQSDANSGLLNKNSEPINRKAKSDSKSKIRPLLQKADVIGEITMNIEPVKSQAEQNLIDSVNMKSKEVFSNQSFLKQSEVKGESDKNIQLISSQAKENLVDFISCEKVISSQCFLQQSDLPEESNRSMELISNEAEENSMMSIRMKSKKGISNQLLIKQTNVKQKSSDKNINLTNSPAKESLVDCLSIKLEKVVSSQALIPQTNVASDSGNKNIQLINSRVKGNLMNYISMKSEKVISNQLFTKQINNQTEASMLDYINEEFEKRNSNQSLMQQTNVTEDLLNKNMQPINSQAKENIVDSASAESVKVISNKLLTKQTDIEWESESIKPICSSVKENLADSSSIKTIQRDESSVKRDDFISTENLFVTKSSEENSKYNNNYNSDEDNVVEENSLKNFEEIRKNLKLQLTSLRNRRRLDIRKDVKTMVLNITAEDLTKSSSNKTNQKSNENVPSNQYSRPLCIHPEITKLEPAIAKQGNDDILNVSREQDLVSPAPNPAERPQLESIMKKQDEVSYVRLKQDLVSSDLNKSDYPVEKPQSEIVTQKDEVIPNVLNEIREIIRKQKNAPKILLLKPIHNLEAAEVENVDNESQKNYRTKSQNGDNISTEDLNSTLGNSKDVQTPILSNLENKTTPLSNVVISPFISNTLDEFLTDAKLNVSYTIPKSGAEEGLRQNYSDEPIMLPVIAEIKEEDSEKSIQETKYKPKTLAEKRRLLEKSKLKEKKRLEKLKKLDEAQKRSYVLFKGKKIFLKANSMGKCIASIECSIPLRLNENSQPRKPSLLTELYKKATTPVKYRPGPLCKKHLLQTDYSNWTTELQTLPKVTLKVMPQLGKPIHQNLLHILPQWDGEVTDDQIQFALSALVTKEKAKQNDIFEFDVSYEKRQTQILTKKIILDKPAVKLDFLAATKENSTTVKEDVAKVIEKLLNYVEIKEISPTLIKYDKDFTTSDDGPVQIVPPVDKHIFVKRKSRFSKTDRELIRLNCKVVSVEVEENEPERQCSKPYCTLGCICKSLQCEKIIGLHCKKVKCIFGCTCPKEKDKIISIAEPTVKLPAGTDLLSMDTVTRIEGEAKRNLAKVEKEFTQTVILTNNKTIVVGFGNKPRRATKTPKKYTDFFDDEIPKDETKEPIKVKMMPNRQCSIILKNWDFSDILPYCLVHHLYNCHCRGLNVFESDISSESHKKEAGDLLKLKKEEIFLSPAENTTSILLNKNYPKQQYPKRTVEESFKAIIRKSSGIKKYIDSDNDFEDTLYSVTGRPLRKRKKIYEADFVFDADAPSSSRRLSGTDRNSHDKTPIPFYYESPYCSRTREISKEYYQKVTSFTNAALYFDFANNLTQADLLKALCQENDNNVSDSDALKKYIIEERTKLLEDTETEIHKKKRKQKIQVRQDENLTIKTTEKVVPIPKPVRKVGKVKSVFKGEIIVNDSEWLKKLGQNAKQPLEGYARILPWTALLNGFLTKSINIYCITDMPLRLLLNVGAKLSGEKILDVETFGQKILAAPLKANASWLLSQSENVREIIKWLLSGTLPTRYKTTSLSFLLVETFPSQFEVRGLCTQGEKQGIKENKADIPEEGEVSDQITEVKHKDMNSEIESLFITKGRFRLRELVEDGCDDDHTDNLYMWVGLPEVYKVAKWRVVFLNNDFAYLYFKNIQYSIKYTDLVKLTDMAKEETLTLVLRNLKIRRCYEHTAFGIYISHNYTDRIFIGPYFINYDEDEVETLRYINQQLVSSECFNKMTGNSNYRCGHWMYERRYYHTPTVYMKDTIDLTKDDTPPRPGKPAVKVGRQTLNTRRSVPLATNSSLSVSTQPPLSSYSTKEEHIIYHNGMSIHIKNSKPRSPSEFNRFIITNIPHFGYLGAYQPDNSTILEVSWPFEKKVLQFENADNARDFLQERFNQLLQPVPETFKIQVIVLIQLDLKEHQPINSDFLSGHCICGYFGTYNFRELSEEFCQQKLNISKEEITKLFAKRAHAYIRKKIEELAEIVEINQNDPVDFNVPTILDKAKEEIKSQEAIRRQQVSEIQAHELEVVAKMKSLYKMVNSLPIKQRNIESKLINEILQIRPNRLGVNEVVEIKDDDDDDEGPFTSIKSNQVIYNVESDDAIVTEQPKKKPLKRKRASVKKTCNSKAAKVAPITSYSGASTPMSILKPQTNKTLKAADSQNLLSNKGKQSILIVRSHQTETHSPSYEKGEIITINEDTETIIINEDMEQVTINEDVETLKFNDHVERITYSDDIETVTYHDNIDMLTINEDMDPVIINEHMDPVTIINQDMDSVTVNDDIESFTINEDMELETVNKVPEYQSEKTENIIDEDDSNQYIIEYDGDGYDPNVTEIIVAQPDIAENIDLSRATIIASVPPTSSTRDNKPITVSIHSQEIQTPLIKTYSKNKDLFTITPIPSQLDMTVPNAKMKKPLKLTDSKELTGKIKLGLQKIIRKSEGNLLLLNNREKQKD